MLEKKIAISLPSTGEEEWLAVKEPLESGWLTQGPKVAQFEKEFSEQHCVKHSLAVTSCTTGLHLILAGLGIGPGDEVIVPSFTWVATANVVLYCGATPILVDVDRRTFNISPEEVKRNLSPRTKAVIAVHLFGLSADFDALRNVVPSHIPIVEDAACAAGGKYHDTFVGGLGRAAAFSFHPRKSITTGEGGMVTTNDSDLAATMDQLRNHGASLSEEQRHRGPKPYLLAEFNLLGFNYRMTDMQGAVGLVQLKKLREFIGERQKYSEFYRDKLSKVKWLRLPEVPDGNLHAWQAYVTTVDPETAPLPRNSIMEFLQSRGVSTRPGTHAIHTLGYYSQRFGFKPNDLPNAHFCSEQTMAIPLHNRMSDEDYEYVVEQILSIG